MARLLILVLLAFPTVALANAGLPMLVIVWPMSVPAFIPVVAIESWVVRRALNISWRVAITQMMKGNLFSTLVGIPLAWVASVAVEFFLAFLVMNVTDSKSYPPHGVGKVGGVIFSAPWLGPFEGSNWIIPLAMIVLLVPFFFASFWTEAWYVGPNLCPEAPERARRAIWNANVVSYIGLLIASVCWLAFGLMSHA
ncbi:hypothetical protein [Noviherbaspirillum sp.]|jgi:hypothetical protein|uniref:hypothetical protein n=1 Tax=Noviherbaspirillum sp. TaxID=1926288 RepID=UPI0025CBACF3|nr:hypothetical protein [Noviherbaspirillum sp.]